MSHRSGFSALAAHRPRLPRGGALGWALGWLVALLLAQQVQLQHPLSHLLSHQPAGPATLAQAGAGPAQVDPAEPPSGGDRADAACLACLAAAGLSAAPPPAVATLLPLTPAAMGRPPTDAQPANAAAHRFRLARGPPPRLHQA